MTTNEKAPGTCDSKGLTTDTNELYSATLDRNSKAESNLRAVLALAGHAVHLLKDGGYLVCKYGYTHHASDLKGLQAFAVRLGVCHE